jgi:hypothetical protein
MSLELLLILEFGMAYCATHSAGTVSSKYCLKYHVMYLLNNTLSLISCLSLLLWCCHPRGRSLAEISRISSHTVHYCEISQKTVLKQVPPVLQQVFSYILLLVNVNSSSSNIFCSPILVDN